VTEPTEPAAPTAPAAPAEPTVGRVERLKARMEATQARVEAARETVAAVDAAFVVTERDRRLAGNLFACAVAYRLFFWTLPVALLLVAVLGFADAAAGDNPEEIAKDAGMSAYLASSVGDAAEQARSSRFVLLVIGLVALYFASSAGAKTMSAIHHVAWGTPPQRFAKGWMSAVGFTAFGLGALGLAFLSSWIRDEPGPTRLAVWVAMVAIFGAYWFVAELLLPHSDAGWWELVPGAILFALGIEVLHLATVLYFAGKVSSSSELYGGLGAAAGVLLWLYFLGRLTVASAMLNATLCERRKARAVSPQRGESQPVATG
jgi:uncharacterized BrkB/YihY/UPF0761 family membrane protein